MSCPFLSSTAPGTMMSSMCPSVKRFMIPMASMASMAAPLRSSGSNILSCINTIFIGGLFFMVLLLAMYFMDQQESFQNEVINAVHKIETDITTLQTKLTNIQKYDSSDSESDDDDSEAGDSETEETDLNSKVCPFNLDFLKASLMRTAAPTTPLGSVTPPATPTATPPSPPATPMGTKTKTKKKVTISESHSESEDSESEESESEEVLPTTTTDAKTSRK